MEIVFLVVVGIGIVIFLLLYGSKGDEKAQRQKRANRFEPFDAKTAQPLPEQTVIFGAPYVVDGDSLVIKKTQIRLFGVDAPEMNHPYGIRAKQKLWALCKNHSLRAEVVAIDAHGRTVAKVYLPDGRDLSAEMVKAGLAIDWAKFSGGIYRDLEVPDARRKMWLADARQKGHMHVWAEFDAKQNAVRTGE
ncbi:thermonuclease family protein [Pseudorhodobacter ferrugineus]|uniref:thermonuclease family protein n=1 Tax=Pseudorhodobacter ferrugineus TaxID=77008 RepID=UPI000415E3F9|nr:thermonuclease family protein [Pseudorhodobacter ferrugineus]